MKKITKFALSLTSIGSVAAPVAAVVSCGGSASSWSDGIYGASDGGNVDDKSFNNQAYDVVVAASGQSNHFIKSNSSNKTDILAAYTAAAANGATTIVGAGFYHADAITDALKDHSYDGINFILADSVVDSDRVLSINFQTAQVGFEAGYAAAKYAAANADAAGDNVAKVATFGGSKIAPVTDYMFGFVQGLKYWNTKNTAKKVELVKPSVLFMQNFSPEGSINGDSTVTKTTAQLIKDGVDVIFPVGGPQQTTVASYIARDSKLNKVRVIGVDADYASQADANLKPFVLTSALKNIATVTTAAIEAIYKDELSKDGAKKPSASLNSFYAQINDATRAKFANGAWGQSVSGGLAENFVGLPLADEVKVLGTPDEVKDIKEHAAKATTKSEGQYEAYANDANNWN